MEMASQLLRVLTLSAIFFATYGEYIPPGPKYRCPKQALLVHPCTCQSESDDGITVLCENTNLASMSIGLNNLATFKIPIVKLTIRKCNIRRLYGSLLYKLHTKSISIEDTPLEKIEEHAFLGVNQTLDSLHLLNTSLKEYPALAFKILGNVVQLKLDGHQIPELPKDAFAGSDLAGKLLKFHLSNGNLSSLSIESLQPLRRLRVLDLHGNKIAELKRNQFKGLREIEVLDLSHNNITKLDASHISDLIKMGWCNVSHNHLTELTRGAFARNSVMKLLNMSHNKIKKLDTNSFKGMRFLRRLYMNDNEISDVGRGTFSTITRIGTIDLARNKIKKIDYQMFHQLNYIEIIDVSENALTEIQKLGFKDVFLAHINLSKNNISKIEGGSFVNCANITTLDLSHNRIQSIHKKAFDEATYASTLLMNHNLLTELNQVPLGNMTGLKVLNVTYNLISKIPRHTFPKLYELHTIDLSHNKLNDIFNAVFQPLFSLRSLNLSHNDMETLKPSTFGPLPTLLELDLSHNQLKSMAKSSLTGLASMRNLMLRNNSLTSLFLLPISTSHLDLSYNQFSELPIKQWPSMNSLLSLNMSHNQLGDSLSKGAFENLLTVQILDLSYNGIKEPPWTALSDLSSLQYLHLEGNELERLDKGAFGKLPVVFQLRLAHNKLTSISNQAFDGLLQLIFLDLTHNNISYLPMEALKGLVAMRELDLSHNKIEKIDNKTHGLLEDCLSLEKLDLSHNKISFVTRKMFPSNPYFPYKLKEIDLSFNSLPVLTYDIVHGTQQVERLNLSHNSIQDIRKGVIGNLTKLRVLDLSFNHLEDIASEREVFRLPTHIYALYLSNNMLDKLPWENINNVSHLETFDVAHNKLSMFSLNLTNLVLNETKVRYRGNPLICDCTVRPLKRFLDQKLNVADVYREIKCFGPMHLSGRNLIDVPEDRLNCPINVNTTKLLQSDPETYDITPDFKFRSVETKSGVIKVKWLVAKNEDIGDAYIIIRSASKPQNLMYEKTLPYFKRTLEINVGKELGHKAGNDTDYELCVLARDSWMAVRGLYKQQCTRLPPNIASSSQRHQSYSVIIILACQMIILTIFQFPKNV